MITKKLFELELQNSKWKVSAVIQVQVLGMQLGEGSTKEQGRTRIIACMPDRYDHSLDLN